MDVFFIFTYIILSWGAVLFFKFGLPKIKGNKKIKSYSDPKILIKALDVAKESSADIIKNQIIEKNELEIIKATKNDNSYVIKCGEEIDILTFTHFVIYKLFFDSKSIVRKIQVMYETSTKEQYIKFKEYAKEHKINVENGGYSQIDYTLIFVKVDENSDIPYKYGIMMEKSK